jgi:hypothetical protein
MARRTKQRPAIRRPNAGRDFLVAVHKLTGLDPARVEAARARVSSLEIEHVADELLQPNVDAAVGATLLVDSLDELADRGVQRTKLESKLRNDPDVWPTWAELRAARNLAAFLQDEGEVQLEASREHGKHADFRFSRPAGEVFRFVPWGGSSAVSVEFKAIGLSDEEVRFCWRAKPTLDALHPPRAFVTVHVPLEFDREGVWMDEAAHQHGVREALKLAPKLPPHTIGLSGAVVVGQGAENAYARRVCARIKEAIAQLPPEDECWIAFHWSNGAPLDAVRSAISTLELPTHVAGILFAGSAVAFPHAEIHNFVSWGISDPEPSGERAIRSLVDDNLARLVLERVERSSGVRASVVRTLIGSKHTDVLVRDGSRRILPFILLIQVQTRTPRFRSRAPNSSVACYT